MNKVKKIMAVVMAVATMAIGCGGISADAASWGLYNTVGAPSSSNKYSDVAGFYVSSSRSSISESCTSYSSGTQSNGTVAYARYIPYAVTSSGTTYSNLLSGTKYHYGKGSSSYSLRVTVPAASTIYGNYTLQNYSGINCAIYGTIS